MGKYLCCLTFLFFTGCNGVISYKVQKPEFPLENMEVKKEHFIDKSEKGKDGYYSYYYEYDIYNFCQSGFCYTVRSYADNPEEASFYSTTKVDISKSDVLNPLFIHAYFYLKEKENKTRFTYFSGSKYKPFELIY